MFTGYSTVSSVVVLWLIIIPPRGTAALFYLDVKNK